MNIIGTCYNWFKGGAREGWKICKEFLEIGEVKLINFSTFSKSSLIYARIWAKIK